jgi:uncharacterized protein YbjT (DUF2867 family)
MTGQKRILVYLANGVQGGAVARQALALGYAVRALVRDPAKSEPLKRLGAEIARGDLLSGAGLEEAHRGIDYVVLQAPLGPPAQVSALIDNAIAAIQASTARGGVAKMASASPSIETDEPGFAANPIVADKLRSSGLHFSIIRPTMYLDNFLRPETRNGIAGENTIVYPLSASRRIAWTSADDAARAALTLLENEAWSCDLVISGAEAVDGEGLARGFSAALGRDVRFQSLPLDAFEREVDSRMGAGVGKRVSSKFRFFEEHPSEAERMLSPTFRPCPELQGFVPATIEAWVGVHRSALLSPVVR